MYFSSVEYWLLLFHVRTLRCNIWDTFLHIPWMCHSLLIINMFTTFRGTLFGCRCRFRGELRDRKNWLEYWCVLWTRFACICVVYARRELRMVVFVCRKTHGLIIICCYNCHAHNRRIIRNYFIYFGCARARVSRPMQRCILASRTQQTA